MCGLLSIGTVSALAGAPPGIGVRLVPMRTPEGPPTLRPVKLAGVAGIIAAVEPVPGEVADQIGAGRPSGIAGEGIGVPGPSTFPRKPPAMPPSAVPSGPPIAVPTIGAA